MEEGEKEYMEIMINGNEDGNVRFWDESGIEIKNIYKFGYDKLLRSDEIDNNEGSNGDVDEEEDEWKKLRKVGKLEKYQDENRLEVKKVDI